eukprot:TRINITY_DN46724_c0_g1_i1.p1 TRINITY_DN46724_c0_g1~~TRINITY_DN46724_c0_g1_i1.p1  ORF type:complete len:258 (-),score=47.51 TRINITY_DN46724_c0_g1_i1:102-875(-)
MAVEASAALTQVTEEDADFEREAPAAGADDSSDDSMDSDGLPALDPYWTSKLNVTKVSEPLPPLKPGTTDGSSGGGKGKGGYGKGGRPPLGAKGKGKGKAFQRDDVGDFFSWARDPGAEDGSRPAPRDRSRSPRRGPAGGENNGTRLETFLSWARSGTETKKEEPMEESNPGASDLNSFMQWAARSPSPSRRRSLARRSRSPSQRHRSPRRRSPSQHSRSPSPDAAVPEDPYMMKEEPDAAGDVDDNTLAVGSAADE